VDQNLNLVMRLTGNTSQLTQALNSAGSQVNRFFKGGSDAMRQMSNQAKNLYQQLNGFSAISKMVAVAGGASILRDAMQRNLEFEKTLLEMKQNAEMTVAQAQEMRRLAIEKSSENMATPTEMLKGMSSFATAGMKFDAIKSSIQETANAALAFRVEIEQMADMDFDLQSKLGIDPAQLKQVHNMLLYHAQQGRYESKPMATEAPKYMNSVATVGITGVKGLNFTGALLQELMTLAPKTQPAEVATFLEHGLGHITSHQQVKGLSKFNIDVKKYMPNGRFYGEGGVQGALDLAQAMKKAGLDDPFKLDKAGFREMYTKKFWRIMMEHHDDIEKMMRDGDAAALLDLEGKNNAEIKSSNFGKMRQMEITEEKGALSDSAQKAVGMWANMNAWAANNPMTALLGAGMGAIGGRLLWKRLFGGGGGGLLESAMSSTGGAGLPVMVTNWPKGLGDPLKASERLRQLPGRAGEAAAGAGAGAAGSTALAAAIPAAIAVGGSAASVAAMDAVQANRDKLNQMSSTTMGGAVAGDYGIVAAILTESQKTSETVKQSHTGFEAWLDRFSASLVELLGGVAERPVEVHLDGRVVADSVNRTNGRDALRGGR
jgi:hypothetical protein